MAVCFVANQHKTIFYREVARRIEARGERVVWISPSRRWRNYLVDAGVRPGAILCMADHYDIWRTGPELTADDEARLARMEAGSGHTVSSLILMDRLLQRRPQAYARAYAALAARLVEAFLDQHGVEVAFGEGTWMLEMVTAALCTASGRTYSVPSTIRIPSTRFAFYDGILCSRVIELAKPTDEHRDMARSLIAGLEAGAVKPHYMAQSAKLAGFRRHWWDEAAVGLLSPELNKGDETVPPLVGRAAGRLRQFRRVRMARGRAAEWFEPVPASPRKPFVLVLLHKQPEASIDVLGYRFNNQLETLRALTKIMPAGHELYIKEHTVAIGDRTPDFYRQIRALPNARLIAPDAHTMSLILEARLTVTTSGTAAFEAGLIGRPAATFASTYFGPVLTANGLNPYEISEGDFRRMLESPQIPDAATREAFLAWLIAQSFEGRYVDSVSDPAALEDENLAIVGGACLEVLSAWRKQRKLPLAS
ncbi:MAG: hypothetical protein KDJ41_08050 [Hyphomicrobiaceae bacterium]|nr:hypothetical protein [Hyphomicrobiaceae bacterium]